MSAVGLTRGMERTLKNELENLCIVKIPTEPKTVAWVVSRAAILMTLSAFFIIKKTDHDWRGVGRFIGTEKIQCPSLAVGPPRTQTGSRGPTLGTKT